MRYLKFTPYNTSYEIYISRICAEDDLPAFWYFKCDNEEHYGTGESRARAYVAAEKQLEFLYAQKHGREPHPKFTPINYAHIAGFDTVKEWRKQYRKDRKSWIAKTKVLVGWTQKL